MAKIIPLFIAAILIFALIKKVNIYSAFCGGVGDARNFIFSLLPCLCAVFITCELMEASGITFAITKLLSPILSAVRIPQELAKLIIIKPFSGSGSLAYLTDIIKNFGADSYIARCACVLYGSTETVFYVSAVYFAGIKAKGVTKSIIIVLICSFISSIFACFLCKFL
ncbi:MAG: hypothetical protein J6B04_01820 [Clostridia bacterium]|nr:hypothetical protein [Clostridia bacterium]